MSELIMQVKNITKKFPASNNRFLTACDDVSLNINAGETVGIVGESGCGKSTLVKTIMNMHAPTSGEVIFHNQDITKLTGEKRRQNCRHIQMVFQDPYSSLNAAMKVKDILAEPLKANGEKNRNEISKKVKDILEKVGLGEEFENKYPNELSGGQRQRIVIGCAMILKPKLVVCDEPVASLDLGVQKQILDLIKKFNKEYGTTFIFISHDLGVVYNISDRVMVLYKGEIQEIRETEEFFSSPQSEYGKYLLEGIR